VELFFRFTEFFTSVELFFTFTVFRFRGAGSPYLHNRMLFEIKCVLHTKFEVTAEVKSWWDKLQSKSTWNQKPQQSDALTPSNPVCLYGMNPSSAVGPLLQLKAPLPAKYAGYIYYLGFLSGSQCKNGTSTREFST
jgi:hypothetical protein